MYNDNSCKVYDMSGRESFSGEFDFTVSKITRITVQYLNYYRRRQDPRDHVEEVRGITNEPD
ncbi:MAG: DUF5711 family protein [Eisenbergiella sp.]